MIYFAPDTPFQQSASTIAACNMCRKRRDPVSQQLAHKALNRSYRRRGSRPPSCQHDRRKRGLQSTSIVQARTPVKARQAAEQAAARLGWRRGDMAPFGAGCADHNGARCPRVLARASHDVFEGEEQRMALVVRAHMPRRIELEVGDGDGDEKKRPEQHKGLGRSLLRSLEGHILRRA